MDLNDRVSSVRAVSTDARIEDPRYAPAPVGAQVTVFTPSSRMLCTPSQITGKFLLRSPDSRPCYGAALGSPHTPKQNHLLAVLPEEDYAVLLPDLELVPMPLDCAVYESGGQLGYLYFSTSSIVSLLYVMENGASAEIAINSNEGLVGILLFMGGESRPSRTVVQSAGHGYRLNAGVLRREFARGGALRHWRCASRRR